MIPVHSSLNPYSAYPTILSTHSPSSTPSQNARSTSTTPCPTPLCPHPRTGTAQPTLYRARSTRSGSRELKKPVHVLPLFDELLELLARHTPSNDTSREVQVPIHVRDAEPLGEDLTLPFECSRAFSSCDYDIIEERIQGPWELVTRRLDLNAPKTQRLEIHALVGDRQADLQVMEFGTACTVLLSFVWVVLVTGRHMDDR
ncbi:hypothetical protein BKA70DRAFT_193620 [Coprinopsis sp. MPI-PUGE-AT-0042]|nr:hypothetical protein BKA70DRAFT_193620 [Coprinopsis sp. MPI-PUGE-AT-0042]